jgi:hypothetical protein
MTPVNCQNCASFVKDTIGDGSGLGQCQSFSDGLKKRPSTQTITLALLARGNYAGDSIFWGGTALRECKVFQQMDKSNDKKLFRE